MGAASVSPRTIAPRNATHANRASKAMWVPNGKRSAPSTARRRIPAAPTASPRIPPVPREQGGFDDHFPHYVPPARTQGLPDGHFLDPAVGADQKQIQEVDHADQQERKGARLHPHQNRAHACDVVCVKGRHNGAKAGIGHHLGHGIVRFQRGILRVDLGLRLRNRRAWFEARNHLRGHSRPNAAALGRDLQGATRKESKAVPRTRGNESRAAERRPRCSELRPHEFAARSRGGRH